MLINDPKYVVELPTADNRRNLMLIFHSTLLEDVHVLSI
jgi:hypothetical protein